MNEKRACYVPKTQKEARRVLEIFRSKIFQSTDVHSLDGERFFQLFKDGNGDVGFYVDGEMWAVADPSRAEELGFEVVDIPWDENALYDFDYKDSVVYVSRYHFGPLPESLRRPCFCCGKEIHSCKVAHLINNGKYFPNVLLHSECADQWVNKTDELCNDIASSYEDYKMLSRIFA